MCEVLVVDDSETVRIEVSQYLQSQGISVDTAKDGLDGLDKAKQHPDLKLILCDINMPQMDGLTMVEKLKSADNMDDVHVIMLTTESCRNMKMKGKSIGVEGWIIKPFNGDAAIAGIKKLIGQ